MANVPNVPGVPELVAYAEDVVGEILMTSDQVIGYGPGLTPLWGLYRGGVPVAVAEAVTAFGYRSEWNIASYPIERGGFESFNRVSAPFQCRLEFAAGSTMAARQALIRSLEAATADGNLTKYDVVTPEIVYPGVNIQSINYDRKAVSGVGLLLIDVNVLEIREQSQGGDKSKSPSGEETKADGNVQGEDITPPTDASPGLTPAIPGIPFQLPSISIPLPIPNPFRINSLPNIRPGFAVM